jgi:hypothetical protein
VDEWEQIEYETTQRVLGAMVAKYGAALSEESEAQARLLGFVAIAPLRSRLEQLEAQLAFTLAWFNISREALDKAMAERA